MWYDIVSESTTYLPIGAAMDGEGVVKVLAIARFRARVREMPELIKELKPKHRRNRRCTD